MEINAYSINMENKKEPTWKETLKIFHERTKKKLAPMKRVMLDVIKKKGEN